MLKKFLILILVAFSFLFFFPQESLAIVDPTQTSNNRFGIHIVDENDLDEAANLVNSGGGDWGYVTLVIRKDERNTQRWQRVFDEMRRLHLIPIVRIATRQQDSGWEKPSFGEIDGWVSFLSSLNWVTKNRYVVISNEPNHAKEWGGEINPEEYARYLKEFSVKLKEENSDFFILPAGFDASAQTSKETMDEEEFIRRMLQEEPEIFENVDGWTSHSYPNPDFSGSPGAIGRGTVLTFEWELGLLQTLGVQKDLPVFITETGWIHDKEGKVLGLSSTDAVGEKLIQAYAGAWNKENVVAVTPFVLKYQSEPFDIFSWTRDTGEFYPFYYEVRNLNKVKGEPVQIDSGKVISTSIPPFVGNSTTFNGLVLVENTGQSIWSSEEMSVYEISKGKLTTRTFFNELEPGQKGVVVYAIKAPETPGKTNASLVVLRDSKPITSLIREEFTVFETPHFYEKLFDLKEKIRLKFLKLFSR